MPVHFLMSGNLGTLNGVPHGIRHVLNGVLIGLQLGAQVNHGQKEEVHHQLPPGLTPMRHRPGHQLQPNSGQRQHPQPPPIGKLGDPDDEDTPEPWPASTTY